jgi:hypothetical protein
MYDCRKCKESGHFIHRNCTRYFPDELKHRPRWYIPALRYWFEGPELRAPEVVRWRASYEPRNGKPYTIDGIESIECPVSIAWQHPELTDVLEILNQSSDQPGALGNVSEWPGAFYDMSTAVKNQDSAREYFQSKANQ